MKNVLWLCGVVAVFFMSCQEKTHVVTRKEMLAKIDSVVAARVVEIRQQGAIDLDHRISIEVKYKADSIIASKMRDTLVKP